MSPSQTAPQEAAVPRRRLLFVTAEQHPTFRADVRVLFGKCLPQHGICSDLFALASSEKPPPWPAGQMLLTDATGSPAVKLLSHLRHSLRLIGAISGAYDAVVVRDRVLTGATAALVCRFKRVPFVYWASFAKPESRVEFAESRRDQLSALRYWVTRVRGWLEGQLLYSVVLPQATHVFVQSEPMRDAFASRGQSPDRMTSVPMGIDLDEFDSSAFTSTTEFGLEHRFVYLGDMAALRRPEVMVHALALALKTEPDIRLDLVGSALEPADRQALQEVIAHLGVSKQVRLTGWLPVQAARNIVSAGVAGISMIPRSPTLDLSSPTKIVEYYALGIPALANDSPDQAKILMAIGADSVECDATALAAAMIDVVRRPSHYREQAERGKKFVIENRSYAVIARRVAEVLLNVIPGSTAIGIVGKTASENGVDA